MLARCCAIASVVLLIHLTTLACPSTCGASIVKSMIERLCAMYILAQCPYEVTLVRWLSVFPPTSYGWRSQHQRRLSRFGAERARDPHERLPPCDENYSNGFITVGHAFVAWRWPSCPMMTVVEAKRNHHQAKRRVWRHELFDVMPCGMRSWFYINDYKLHIPRPSGQWPGTYLHKAIQRARSEQASDDTRARASKFTC